MLLLLLACARAGTESGGVTPPTAAHYRLHGAQIAGLGPAEIEIDDGRIVSVGAGVDTSLPATDVSGRWLAPAFIDSHVHLAYLPEADALVDGGIAGVVDLAAPISFLADHPGAPEILASGPMVTAVGGYPTQSWGSAGYGYECADAAAAAAAVRVLAKAGARVIKLPVTDGPSLPPDALVGAAEAAHSSGLKVASHAVADSEAAIAAAAGVDVLAHTPLETLTPTTLAAWRGRAVITTLAAFGGGSTAVQNLAALRAGGVTVLYGTDFGNTRTTGIDPMELTLMRAAGMDGAAILAAGTRVPADYWGFSDLGAIAPGKAADLLVLDADPLLDPLTLARPLAVVYHGAFR